MSLFPTCTFWKNAPIKSEIIQRFLDFHDLLLHGTFMFHDLENIVQKVLQFGAAQCQVKKLIVRYKIHDFHERQSSKRKRTCNNGKTILDLPYIIKYFDACLLKQLS